MIDLALFLIVSVIALAFSVLVFVFKDILHAAIALSGVFLMNSLFFIVLSQPLLAVVQLFIMVGGITTFLFVGVAAAPYSRFQVHQAPGSVHIMDNNRAGHDCAACRSQQRQRAANRMSLEQVRYLSRSAQAQGYTTLCFSSCSGFHSERYSC